MTNSRRFAGCVLSLVTVGAVVLPIAPAHAASQALGAVALGSDEPTAPAAADLNATGTVDLRIDPTTGDVCVRATLSGLSGPITMAHIHSGAVGANGPVLVTLPSTATAVAGCVQATPADAQAILAAPGSFYFNAHTAASPGGAARGQLTASLFNATLTGAAEVPGPGASNASGSAVVAVDTTANRACVLFNLTGVDLPAAMAHLHSGAVGVAGPVVVPLVAPIAAISASCALGTPAVLAAIIASPIGHYANVHTAALPGGAVRGQLGVRSVSDVPVPTAGGAATTTTSMLATSTSVAAVSSTTAPPTVTTAAAATTLPPPSALPPATPVPAEPNFTG